MVFYTVSRIRRAMPIITIAGPPGSGKTTVSRILAQHLELPHVYTGDIFRKMAKERGMSLEAFGDYALEHPEIDIELDRRQVELTRSGDLILEGRLAAWMLRRRGIDALKVWIDAETRERARRVARREKVDLEEALERMLTREKQEKHRYRTIYDLDLADTSIYDLVVDSTDRTPDEVADLIVAALEGQRSTEASAE